MFKTKNSLVVTVLSRLGIEPDRIENERVSVYHLSRRLFWVLDTYQLIK